MDHLGTNVCLCLAQDVMYRPQPHIIILSMKVETWYISPWSPTVTNSSRESTVISGNPKRPWHKVGVDLFSWGWEQLHSNWTEVNELTTTSSNEVMNKKALLSQRWPRDAPYMWMPWKISGVPAWLRPRLLIPKLLMTVVIDRMKVHQMAHVGVSQSRGLKLFGREIIFEEFQPMWSRYGVLL